MVIKATFIGNDNLSYENGKEYRLYLFDYSSMSIKKIDNTGYCEYESISSFLRNWDNIKRISDILN